MATGAEQSVAVGVTRGMKRVVDEIRERVVGPRRVVRVGAALPVAGARISERLDAGEDPRDDGLFDAEFGRAREVGSGRRGGKAPLLRHRPPAQRIVSPVSRSKKWSSRVST